MKNLIGRKVIMKPRIAKWHLNHLDVYIFNGGSFDQEIIPETIINAMAAFGWSVSGIITHQGDYYKIKYTVRVNKKKFVSHCWYERKDFELV